MMKEFCIKLLFLISISFMIVSCDINAEKLSEEFNSAEESNALYLKIEDSLPFVDKYRSIVYLLDASCSKCISSYLNFVTDFNINSYECDSLYTIVYGCNDLLLIDYYKRKFDIADIANERYIIDKNNWVAKFHSKVSDSNIMLLDNGCILFYSNSFNYTLKEGVGLVKIK
ncbi:MAG: hypothetical protein IKQ46_04735 [Bacteroidales bacterium]|nr:hypothetical protein [Bacteroidales bacterium]